MSMQASSVSWCRAASVVLAAGLSACSSAPGLVPSAESQTLRFNVPSARSCHVTKTLSPSGGFLTLPTCSGFSGKIWMPTFNANGTVTAKLTVSRSNLGAYKNPKGTIYYMQWVFTSSSTADTQIGFYGTQIPHAGCRITGPSVKPGTVYSGDFEVPTPNHPIKRTKIGITATLKPAVGHSVLGLPFVGTPVLVGVKNYVLLSTST
ncbi:MAG: hypothetical protein JO277_11640 [Candidatus Eremiobacteraeota bacterium]|nr:hypothetical protein [Candidatus Eremiobacteraeota bacterium]